MGLSLVLYYLLAIGFASITLAVIMQPHLAGRALMNWPMYVFSKISYSWYLVHLTCVPGTNVLLEYTLGFSQWSNLARFCVFLPTYVVISLAGTLALHFCVEKPFLLLKDRI